MKDRISIQTLDQNFMVSFLLRNKLGNTNHWLLSLPPTLLSPNSALTLHSSEPHWSLTHRHMYRQMATNKRELYWFFFHNLFHSEIEINQSIYGVAHLPNSSRICGFAGQFPPKGEIRDAEYFHSVACLFTLYISGTEVVTNSMQQSSFSGISAQTPMLSSLHQELTIVRKIKAESCCCLQQLPK